MGKKRKYTLVCKCINSAILIFTALYFLFIPGLLVLYYSQDSNIAGKGIPKIAWRLHKDLTPRLEGWARQRVASKKAEIDKLFDVYDVPRTEWAMFSCVYYLWATENLQSAWEADRSLSRRQPRKHAREAIEAAVELIMDPVHHDWVRFHWGADYMHEENVFFRSLIIAGLTSYETLVEDSKYTSTLRDQVDTLAAELDASPHGVLEDYPAECYPIDVFVAIACIKRADEVLGTDHSEFIERSVRAFEGDMLDSRGLIPYLMEDETGRLLGPSRGVGNSYTLIFARELWPKRAKEWYRKYEKHFWQERWWAAGFREYPKQVEPELENYVDVRTIYDVDAGPIIGGFSPAANAFGMAAAKVNGRFDHAYTLSSQVIAASWPLPDGGLLGPRFISSREHAPYIGEACLLFFFSQHPHPTAQIVRGGHWPGCVYIALAFYLGLGALLLLAVVCGLYKYLRNRDSLETPHPQFQFIVWAILIAGGGIILGQGCLAYGTLAILLAQLLPRIKKQG